MKVTIDHAASSYGVPVILDASGAVMDYAAGIKAARSKLGLTAAQLAERLGVSERTVNGWEQGRMPEVAGLNMLGKLLRAKKS
jgi:DNA-binding transcriptional regulator YiaG